MAVLTITSQSFQEIISKKQGIQIFRFWAEWCQPCVMMAPIYREVEKELSEQMLFAEVNVQNEPDLSIRHNVRSIPTVIIYKDGLEINRFSGFMQAFELKKTLLSMTR